MSENPAQKLHPLGTSVWYDNISRDLLNNGELKRLVAEWGVRGLTSNPTIFDNAISNSEVYDAQINSLKGKGLSTDQVFEELAVQDIAAAADLLRPVYESSQGNDGFCSIEVSPMLARDAEGTIAEAKRLFQRLERPNIMIKIPGTEEGLPAIQACLEAGIHINVTLLFSVGNYAKVAQTYCEALRARHGRGESVKGIRSVASFFVSRVDSSIDSQLEKLVGGDKDVQAKQLLGAFGIANSKLAYKKYQEIFQTDQFADLRSAGAVPQRPLWASTSTKNPDYRDVMYVEELIGDDTVNTMPHNTLEAFVDHGVAEPDTVCRNVEEAESIPGKLSALGIDVDASLEALQAEGVEKFIKSFSALNENLAKKL